MFLAFCYFGNDWLRNFIYCVKYSTVFGSKNWNYNWNIYSTIECKICTIDLLLIFEKSRWTNLMFLSISNLIFTTCVTCKIQVWNTLKINFVQLDFSKIKWSSIGCMSFFSIHNPTKWNTCLYTPPKNVWAFCWFLYINGPRRSRHDDAMPLSSQLQEAEDNFKSHNCFIIEKWLVSEEF